MKQSIPEEVCIPLERTEEDSHWVLYEPLPNSTPETSEHFPAIFQLFTKNLERKGEGEGEGGRHRTVFASQQNQKSNCNIRNLL